MQRGREHRFATWPLEKYTIAQHDMVTDSTSTFTHVQAVLIMPPMEVYRAGCGEC